MDSNKKKKALIAMSGGVDSSVAAAIMKERGYDCIGITMKLYRDEDILPEGVCGIEQCSRTCCSLSDVEDARNVALKLGIPYYVWNFTNDFRNKVMKKFVDSYEQGFTPNPCIDCNRFMKFEELYLRAKMLECDVIVTGHYAQIEYDEAEERYCLKKAVDTNKDQSYVLYSLTNEQLAHTVFPLGNLTKPQVREIAEKYGFINAEKPESQDICFVPDGDYAKFIEKFTGKKSESGNFVTVDGKILGQHKGIIHYTIGQRRGLGIAAENSLFVKEIIPETNEVVLAGQSELFQSEVKINDLYLNADALKQNVSDAPRADVLQKQLSNLAAKIRYRQKEQPVTITSISENEMHLLFREPQRAITAGQALVLYQDDRVLGGGTIVR